MCLSHLIYTVRPCLIHICHVAPMPCSDHAVLLKIKWERHILNPYRHGMGAACYVWIRLKACLFFRRRFRLLRGARLFLSGGALEQPFATGAFAWQAWGHPDTVLSLHEVQQVCRPHLGLTCQTLNNGTCFTLDVPQIPNVRCFFLGLPGFANLSMCYEQHVDEYEYGILVECYWEGRQKYWKRNRFWNVYDMTCSTGIQHKMYRKSNNFVEIGSMKVTLY
jgi:hypothetical protein